MRPRLLPFTIVGALGFIVQTGAFLLLTTAGWPLVASTVVAVEIAVLHNFVWHERWTWRDRTRAGSRSRRLGAFVLSTAVTSVLGNVVFVLLYGRILQGDALVAAIAANGTTTIFNFAAADRLVFRCV